MSNLRFQRIFVGFPAGGRYLVLPPREQLVVSVKLDFNFIGEEILAYESKRDATVICGFYVDKVSQFPPEIKETPTSTFVRNPLSSGIRLKLCEAGKSISFVVRNVTDEMVTWRATVEGRAT